MILDYIALAALIIGALLVFYTFIFIHDLPHQVAKQRSHPHSDAIGVACWLSLLTLHAIWPLVFIWALTKQDSRLIAGSIDGQPTGTSDGDVASETLAGQSAATEQDLLQKLAGLEQRLAKLESRPSAAVDDREGEV